MLFKHDGLAQENPRTAGIISGVATVRPANAGSYSPSRELVVYVRILEWSTGVYQGIGVTFGIIPQFSSP
jgi:hypothetical protein